MRFKVLHAAGRTVLRAPTESWSSVELISWGRVWQKEVLVSDTRMKAISLDQPLPPSSNLTSATTLKYFTESSEHSYEQPCNSQPTKPSQTEICVQTGFSLIDAACQTISGMAPVSTAVQAVCDSIEVACETAPDSSILKKPILSVARCTPISIPPRKIYHPAVINACLAICDKHPSQVTKDEAKKFDFYMEQKRKMGQPVESDLIYLPTSMRNCLHCGHLT